MSRKPDEVREITEKLEEGVKAVFESEKYKNYLNTMSKFHKYSFKNLMLISMQNPEATLVAGFKAWQKNFDRHVKRGEEGIRILAPTQYKKKKKQKKLSPETNEVMLDAEGKPIIEEVEVTINSFRVVSVFDVSQTEGKELPKMVEELSAGVKDYEKFMQALKEVSPVPIEFENIEGVAKGYFSNSTNRIAIKNGMSQSQTVKTAIHEVAHAKLHSRGKNLDVELSEQKDRPTKEVEAESVAYTVCQHFGIDTSEYSFGYIAAWGRGRKMEELKLSLDTIQKTASELITGIEERLQKQVELQKEKTEELKELELEKTEKTLNENATEINNQERGESKLDVEEQGQVKILGYYKRERDGNEYIHYSESGKEWLTNGNARWSLENREDRLTRLTKAETIDINKIYENLTKSSPYSELKNYLDLKLAKPEVTLTVAECSEFHNLGEYYEGITSVDEALVIYNQIPPERINGIRSIGIQVNDVQMDIYSGNVIDLGMLEYTPEISGNKEAVELLKELMEKFPDAEILGRENIQELQFKTENVKEPVKMELTEISQEAIELVKQNTGLNGVDFSNCSFNGIKFDSDIEKCNFTNSKFYDCRFTVSEIKECNFTNCDMDADFSTVTVKECNFTNARMEGSVFVSNFIDNNFEAAKLERINMVGPSEVRGNNFEKTRLDTVFFAQNVSMEENKNLSSVKITFMDKSLEEEYKSQQVKALAGEKFEYGKAINSVCEKMEEQRNSRYLSEYAEKHKSVSLNKAGTKNTVIINAFGGPGAGKTTACHMIVAELRKAGFEAEYVSEYAKDLVYENNMEMLNGKEYNQFEILKEQVGRLDSKVGKVDFIVTDAPIALNQIYNVELTDYYKEMIKSLHADYSNFNFFIKRNNEQFKQEGRVHNLEESIEKDKEIKNMLSEYGLEHAEYTYETIDNVVDTILGKGENNMENTMPENKKYLNSKELEIYVEPGAVIGEEEYKYFTERFRVKELREDYFQIADEVMEPLDGEMKVITPLNPDTQKSEPVYRTFVTENGEHRYVGYCFAGDKVSYGEKTFERKLEQFHEKAEIKNEVSDQKNFSPEHSQTDSGISVNNMVKVHLYDTNGKEIKTNNFDEVFKVYEKDGKLGIDWNNEFAAFETFASSVVFENTETGEHYHFSNLSNSIEKIQKTELGEDEMTSSQQAEEIETDSHYPVQSIVTSWEDIEKRWEELEKNAGEYTPDEYDEAKRGIETLEIVLEEEEKAFIESIEDVKVSEKIEAEPVGTINNETTECYSEKEFLEKYKDAMEKTGEVNAVINSPEDHLLLRYKLNDKSVTLEEFCDLHYKEGNRTVYRDVVRETGERLTEFGDSALKIKGESEKEIEINHEPKYPPMTEEQVKNITDIIKNGAPVEQSSPTITAIEKNEPQKTPEAVENNNVQEILDGMKGALPENEAKQLESIANYISSMEKQLKEVGEQLNIVKEQLSTLKTGNPEVDNLIKSTEVLEKRTFSLQEKLQEIKQSFTEFLKNIADSIKQTGQSQLNKVMEHFKVEEKLQSFQGELSKLTADIMDKEMKICRISHELGQVGEHIKNVDKVIMGQQSQRPNENAGAALQKQLTEPLRKSREILGSIGNKTEVSIKKIKKLKEQVKNNNKAKEMKKEEKQKNKQEKRKKEMKKSKAMDLER